MPQLQARSKEVAHRVSTMGSRFGAFGRSVVASTSEVFDQVGTGLSCSPTAASQTLSTAAQHLQQRDQTSRGLGCKSSSAVACSLSHTHISCYGQQHVCSLPAP